MHAASPRDSTIKKAFVQLSAELIKRYDRDSGCTRGQLTKTAKDLAVADDIFPYACAALLKEEDLRSLKGGMTSVDWEEVENRTQRIVGEIVRAKVTGDRFYESHLGWPAGPGI
ncbi:MAG TPA: hypothetical protein VMP11_14290 [Verrucomicrobiae bacterium]|nr:hypothetical protein [Verrucomicrobiae bacterium]